MSGYVDPLVGPFERHATSVACSLGGFERALLAPAICELLSYSNYGNAVK